MLTVARPKFICNIGLIIIVDARFTNGSIIGICFYFYIFVRLKRKVCTKKANQE